MASDMSDRLKTNSDLIRNTRQEIEKSLGQGTGSAIQKCSDVSARDYDVRFRNKVSCADVVETQAQLNIEPAVSSVDFQFVLVV